MSQFENLKMRNKKTAPRFWNGSFLFAFKNYFFVNNLIELKAYSFAGSKANVLLK